MTNNNFDSIDVYLNDLYFHDKKDGFFLQAGAYDGKSDSITYSYQKQLGWKGLLVEPNTNLIDSIKRNRRLEDIVLNVGLGNKTQILDYEYLPSRADSGGFELSNQQKQKLKQVGFNGISKKSKLQVFAYQDLVRAFNIEKIDIAVVDVEGYQNKVLSNIVQSDVKPTFIIAEFINSDKEQLKKICYRDYDLIKEINKDLIFQRRYNLLIITRCSRVKNIIKIKEDLDKKFKGSNFNYVWFAAVDKNKIDQKTFEQFKSLAPEDSRNRVIIKLIEHQNTCGHGSDLLNIALFDKDVKDIDFVYTLDDDNFIHQDLTKIINQNIQNGFDMLVVNIQGYITGNIKDLKVICQAKIDTASMVFNYKTLVNVGGYTPLLNGNKWVQDSLTCSKFIQLNKKIIYTQKNGAYYNKIK